MTDKKDRFNHALAMLDVISEVASGAKRMLRHFIDDAEFYEEKLKEAVEEYERLTRTWWDEDDETKAY